MASNKFLEETGLSRLWANTKSYVNDTFSHGFGGGENLLTDGEKEYKANLVRVFELDLELFKSLQGQTITVSYDAKAETASDYKVDCYFRRSDDEGGAYTPTGTQYLINTTYQRNTWTTTVPNLVTNTGTPITKLYLYIRGGTYINDSSKGNFFTKKVKIERGAIATPWSLAPSENFINVTDYQMLNGITNVDGDFLIIANFPTYQVLYVNMWLSGMNLTQAWQGKDAISIPLKYFRFINARNTSTGAGEYWDNNEVLSGTLNAETGIIAVGTRSKGVSNTRFMNTYLIY